MAVGFRNSSSGDVAAPGNLAVSLPGGTLATDVLILAIVSKRTGSVGVGSYLTPSGWTAIKSNTSNDGTNSLFLQTFRALGSVANLTFTKSGTVTSAGWACLAFTGVDNSNPVDSTEIGGFDHIAGSSTITTGAITTVNSGAVVLCCAGDYNNGSYSASAYSFTPVENAAANQAAAVLYDLTPQSPGSHGAFTLTSTAAASGDIFHAGTIALKPAAGSAKVPWHLFSPAAAGQGVG